MDEVTLNWVFAKQRKKKNYNLADCSEKLADTFLKGLIVAG